MRDYTHTHTHTRGENKTQKSCTVLIEGKDTHDCLKSERQKEGRICYVLKKKKNKYLFKTVSLDSSQQNIPSVNIVLPFGRKEYTKYGLSADFASFIVIFHTKKKIVNV